MLCTYAVPDAPGLITRPELDTLPDEWDAIPHHGASATDGADWLRAAEQLALVLPSVVVPQARNLLLNPLHPAIAQVSLVDQIPFRLDQRLAM